MGYHAMVEQAYSKELINENTIRFFKIAYPVLKVRVDIKTASDNKEFHLIEKYIDNLIAGKSSRYSGNNKSTIFIKDKDSALSLLGLDYEVYDVATYFYNDLMYMGRFFETEEGLLSADNAPENLKLKREKKVSQIATHIIVNPFDMELCGKKVRNLKAKTANDMKMQNRERIAFINPPAYCYNAEELERLINEQNFDAAVENDETYAERMMNLGMPNGTCGIEIVTEADEPFCETYYIPHYLAVDLTEDGRKVYRLCNVVNGQVSYDFDINSDGHEYLRNTIDNLTECDWNKELGFNISPRKKIFLKDFGGNGKSFKRNDSNRFRENVSLDKNGNYIVELRDIDLFDIAAEGATLALPTMDLLLKERKFIITDRDAGKLISFVLTERQKEFCNSVINNPKEIIKISTEFLEETYKDTDDNKTQYLIAWYYNQGFGVLKDPQKSFEWLEKAASSGYEKAYNDLGVYYLCGFGTEQNYEKAVESFKVASKANIPLAVFNLGCMYYKGLGTLQDYDKAVELFTRGKELDYLPARFMLAKCLENGFGIKPDKEAAQKEYSSSFWAGHLASGLFAAKYCFQNGNYEEAYAYTVDIVYEKDNIDKFWHNYEKSSEAERRFTVPEYSNAISEYLALVKAEAAYINAACCEIREDLLEGDDTVIGLYKLAVELNSQDAAISLERLAKRKQIKDEENIEE